VRASARATGDRERGIRCCWLLGLAIGFGLLVSPPAREKTKLARSFLQKRGKNKTNNFHVLQVYFFSDTFGSTKREYILIQRYTC
jgi:hypothetical protein